MLFITGETAHRGGKSSRVLFLFRMARVQRREATLTDVGTGQKLNLCKLIVATPPCIHSVPMFWVGFLYPQDLVHLWLPPNVQHKLYDNPLGKWVVSSKVNRLVYPLCIPMTRPEAKCQFRELIYFAKVSPRPLLYTRPLQQTKCSGTNLQDHSIIYCQVTKLRLVLPGCLLVTGLCTLCPCNCSVPCHYSVALPLLCTYIHTPSKEQFSPGLYSWVID